LNLLTIITKNYIYKCKDKIPNIVEFKFKIKNYYSLELYIARKNNKLAAFDKFWGPSKYAFPDL
jgi:dihydrodipicolinate synthase/N-acetylneuraminate lyase